MGAGSDVEITLLAPFAGSLFGVTFADERVTGRDVVVVRTVVDGVPMVLVAKNFWCSCW